MKPKNTHLIFLENLQTEGRGFKAGLEFHKLLPVFQNVKIINVMRCYFE